MLRDVRTRSLQAETVQFLGQGRYPEECVLPPGRHTPEETLEVMYTAEGGGPQLVRQLTYRLHTLSLSSTCECLCR